MTTEPTGHRTGLTLQQITQMLWARIHTGLFIDSIGFRDLEADKRDLVRS